MIAAIVGCNTTLASLQRGLMTQDELKSLKFKVNKKKSHELKMNQHGQISD